MTTVQAGSPYERQETMEITGFVVLSTSSDGSNTSDTVKRSLHTINHVETESLIYGRGDREACKRFMKSGAEDSNAFMERVHEVVGLDHGRTLLYQGPVIIESAEGHSAWPPGPAHPSHDAVSAFRDLAIEKGTRITFRLYPHNIPIEMVNETRPVIRKLQQNEVLFVKGSVMIEIELPARGCFVWQGNSYRPMGFDMVQSGVFEFMKI